MKVETSLIIICFVIMNQNGFQMEIKFHENNVGATSVAHGLRRNRLPENHSIPNVAQEDVASVADER